MGRIYIDRNIGRIERENLYCVRLTLKDGTVYGNLEPRRLFPISNHTMYISLLDSREKEIAFVRDIEAIDEDSRGAIEGCLKEYYMIPKIKKVIKCVDRFGVLKWTVETDRGEITFDIRNRNSDIKHLYGTNRVIIRDSNDNRYEIPDVENMDAHSSRQLFAYL